MCHLLPRMGARKNAFVSKCLLAYLLSELCHVSSCLPHEPYWSPLSLCSVTSVKMKKLALANSIRGGTLNGLHSKSIASVMADKLNNYPD